MRSTTLKSNTAFLGIRGRAGKWTTLGCLLSIWIVWIMFGMSVGRRLSSAAHHRREDEAQSSTCALYPQCSDVRRLPTSLDGTCAFDVTNGTEYLPDPSLIECLMRTADKTIWLRDARNYQSRVRTIQNPSTSCDKSDSWHVVKFTSHGHGVNAFYMAINVGNHWDRGIPAVSALSAYRFGSHNEQCSGKSYVHRGWSCHMSPLSEKCTLNDAATLANTVNLNKQLTPHRGKDWCLPNGRYEHSQYGRCKCLLGYLPSEDGSHCLSFEQEFKDKRKWLPRYEIYHKINRDEHDVDEDYAMTSTDHWISRLAPGEVFAMENTHDPAHWPYRKFIRRYPAKDASRLKLKHGFFWWMLQNIWILHKDAPKRETMEVKVRALLGENTECVAVHVRRGDSCDDPTARHRTCPELNVYARAVKKLKDKYFTSSGRKRFVVFLASDDPSTIQEARQLSLEEGGDEWLWQPIDRARYVNGKVVDNNPDLFSDTAMDELYFDLWAISYCRVGFVASFASSVAWNAYGLAVGRHGFYVPFISVDWPWGHKILGGHHAKDNLFDGTVDEEEVQEDRPLLLASSVS